METIKGLNAMEQGHKKVGDGGGSGDDEVAAGGDILRRKIFE